MRAELAELEPGVSVVVPTFHAVGTLWRLVDRVAAVFEEAGRPYEIVFVDDGSEDGTWEEIEGLAAEVPAVRGLRLARNSGQHNALLAGVRAARHAYLVTLDDDLQYRPESVPPMLEVLEEGADLVYGVATDPDHGRSRGVMTRASKWALSKATGEPLIASVSALRAFRTSMRSVFAEFDGPYVSLDSLLLWSTGRVVELEVPHDPRTAGVSGYSLRALIRHALTTMVGFSSRPLRAASLLGFFCTALGLVVLAYVLIRYVAEGGGVPGFAFLASAIAIFSGVQLFAIGMIGEYLSRIYPRILGQPSYSVAESTEPDRPAKVRPAGGRL